MQPPLNLDDILNGLIQSYSIEYDFDNNVSHALNKKSTFLDVAYFEDQFREFEVQHFFKRKNAPIFETALELWIKEIESTVGDEDNYFYNYAHSEYLYMCSYAFWETTKGNSIYLRSIADKLLEKDENSLEFRFKLKENLLTAIAKGTVYAYSLPRLKKELNELKNTNDEIGQTVKPLSNNSKKLKWDATPAQFGFIIDRLIQAGYLNRPTSSYPKDVDFYLQIFEMEGTPGTIEKELSETTNSLSTENRNKFTIPDKDKLR